MVPCSLIFHLFFTAGKPLELHGVAPTPKPDPERLQRELAQKIKFGGPITVYQYMQEVLTNPVTGYYTGKDEVLGAKYGHQRTFVQ